MKNILGFLVFWASVTQASIIEGKHSCQGMAEVVTVSGNETTTRRAECEDLSIEISRNGNELQIKNHYSGCGGGKAVFKDRTLLVDDDSLFENGKDVGFFIRFQPALLWSDEVEPGLKRWFFLGKDLDGKLKYLDSIDYGHQIIRHQGICK